jgi:hypothetical protein
MCEDDMMRSRRYAAQRGSQVGPTACPVINAGNDNAVSRTVEFRALVDEETAPSAAICGFQLGDIHTTPVFPIAERGELDRRRVKQCEEIAKDRHFGPVIDRISRDHDTRWRRLVNDVRDPPFVTRDIVEMKVRELNDSESGTTLSSTELVTSNSYAAWLDYQAV